MKAQHKLISNLGPFFKQHIVRSWKLPNVMIEILKEKIEAMTEHPHLLSQAASALSSSNAENIIQHNWQVRLVINNLQVIISVHHAIKKSSVKARFYVTRVFRFARSC